MVLHWLWTKKEVSLPGERLDRKTFKQLKFSLYETAKTQNFCKDLISPKYLKDEILKAKYVIISKHNDTFEGFAVFDISEDSLNIPLICSGVKGVGTKIIDAILEYSKTVSDIKYIHLESIGESYGFYIKKGFQLFCPKDGLCPMIYVKNK